MPEGFKGKCHIFYGSRSVDMIDGLPKWSGHKDTSKLIPEVAETEECVVLCPYRSKQSTDRRPQGEEAAATTQILINVVAHRVNDITLFS
jgi:hypothetical protein